MITAQKLSRAQKKWFSLLEELFPNIAKRDIITVSELKLFHAKLTGLREIDKKKYKVSWPIWLISNNAVSRGVYALPKDATQMVSKDVSSHAYYDEYIAELRQFKVVV